MVVIKCWLDGLCRPYVFFCRAVVVFSCMLTIGSAAAVASEPPKIAVDFRHRSYIETQVDAGDLGLDGNAERTAEATVYTRNFNNGGIFYMGTVYAGGRSFSLRTQGNTDRWLVQYWGGGYDKGFNHASENRWVHFALVHTGSETIVYADGEEVLRESLTINTATAFPFRIGTWWSRYFFDGKISQVRLWNRALSQEELIENRNVALEGDEDGLVGYWPLDEGMGKRAMDLAAGNDGVFKGNPAWVINLQDIREVKTVNLGDNTVLEPAEDLVDPDDNDRYRWYHAEQKVTGQRGPALELTDITEEDLGRYFLMDRYEAMEILGVFEVTDNPDAQRNAGGPEYMRLPDWSYFEKDLAQEKEVEPDEDITLGPVTLQDPLGEVEYQWYFNGEKIEGAVSDTYEITGTMREDLGSYYVRINDDCALTPVNSTRLTLPDWPIWRHSLEEQRSVSEEGVVRLGPVELYAQYGEVTYQWFHDEEPIEGATESSLELSDLSHDDLGLYHVEVNDEHDHTPIESAQIELLQMLLEINGTIPLADLMLETYDRRDEVIAYYLAARALKEVDETTLRQKLGEERYREVRSHLDELTGHNLGLVEMTREGNLRTRRLSAQLDRIDLEASIRAVENKIENFGDDYPQGEEYLDRLKELKERHGDLGGLRSQVERGNETSVIEGLELFGFVRAMHMDNPLIDFDRLLVVHRHFGDEEQAGRRSGAGAGFLYLNSYIHTSCRYGGWNNQIAVLSDIRDGDPGVETLYRPQGDPVGSERLIRDIEFEYDGERLLFSSHNGRWALYELDVEDGNPSRISPEDYPDQDFFEGTYLPDGRIILSSTASLGGLDCEGGARPVSDLYLLDRENDSMRQLTFDQVQPQHPTVMNDGRVLYMRWEYCDLPHYYSRFLFTMNPDGTAQMPYYGSGSYFPTAFKHARAIPGHPRKVVGIIGGHHGLPESGRLAIIDPGLARGYPFKYEPESKSWGEGGDYINIFPEVLPAEKTGFVQEIPGYGEDVVGNVVDDQGDSARYQFVHPYPLSEEYFLVSMKPPGGFPWGIYLVDIYDNFTLIKEIPDGGLFEPIPFQARERPRKLPDRVDLESEKASVLLQDIYEGPGLEGVPRGTVDRLRVFQYHYAYNEAGDEDSLGYEGPWDVRRILGTVPVEKDGSAHFEIPANTPISIQPIDEKGRALQLMRSWLVGMPGEAASCVGCHESASNTPPSASGVPIAFDREAEEIEPWLGEPRPFSFVTEVQPVLDKYCAGCHNQEAADAGDVPFTLEEPNPESKQWSYKESTSYQYLHPYVHSPGAESDLRMRTPMEFHASTSPLILMLEKGHHGVELDEEAWERLYTWIDFNAPHGGRWDPPHWRGHNQVRRRIDLAEAFGVAPVFNVEEEAERMLKEYIESDPPEPVIPDPVDLPEPDGLKAEKFPFSPQKAEEMQQEAGAETEKVIELAPGFELRLRLIPAGTFIMGDQEGYPDERERALVTIEEPFWMGETEITNRQYSHFDPEHDTGYHDRHGKDQTTPGFIANHADQPVSRVSWLEAMEFCEWLSEETGLDVTLPTEAQWEWAARAGAETRFFFGDKESDFSDYANLADKARSFMRVEYDGTGSLQRRYQYDLPHPFPLHDDSYDDGSVVTNYVGEYDPNPWGLYDIIGNVSEWTRSSYSPYPYDKADGRNEFDAGERKVARGGSWYERPKDAGAAIRFPYYPFQKVFNVGFRIILESND